ncbi:hypothetical protein [Desulfospira joergensenii]|uniref:hypothetical protein n=1 Tax=Desulfospira joergensenii TaxID=53329 RepID=UPI0003B65EDF|nr:hypothetical protein [Desulfospira joergensenii]
MPDSLNHVKNTDPNEKRGHFVTSGIRIGLPLVTSRGMKEEESIKIAEYICDVLDSDASIPRVAAEVNALCREYPLYT